MWSTASPTLSVYPESELQIDHVGIRFSLHLARLSIGDGNFSLVFSDSAWAADKCHLQLRTFFTCRSLVSKLPFWLWTFRLSSFDFAASNLSVFGLQPSCHGRGRGVRDRKGVIAHRSDLCAPSYKACFSEVWEDQPKLKEDIGLWAFYKRLGVNRCI
jgi:hypothetical protein